MVIGRAYGKPKEISDFPGNDAARKLMA